MATLKSIGAVLAGFLTVVVLSIGMDFILESLGFFPPQNEPDSYTWWMLLIALIYRCAATVAGGYVTARLAPNRPMRHALILGIVGIVAGTAGAIATWGMTPHHWYPIALVVTAVPCTWYGGTLKTNNTQNPVIA
jgi:hypothetical protein